MRCCELTAGSLSKSSRSTCKYAFRNSFGAILRTNFWTHCVKSTSPFWFGTMFIPWKKKVLLTNWHSCLHNTYSALHSFHLLFRGGNFIKIWSNACSLCWKISQHNIFWQKLIKCFVSDPHVLVFVCLSYLHTTCTLCIYFKSPINTHM